MFDRRLWRAALAVSGMLLLTSPARGHHMHLFALARGSAIEGRVYFHGDAPASGATVQIFDPAGELLDEIAADEEGQFRFECRYRCDHRLVADDGSGHRAVFTVHATELPADLSPRRGAPLAPATLSQDASLAAELQTLNTQIVQLRTQLDHYQQQLRLKDLIGGVGYIVGALGLWFFAAGVTRQRAEKAIRNDKSYVS
jgi:nickel transport protein